MGRDSEGYRLGEVGEPPDLPKLTPYRHLRILRHCFRGGGGREVKDKYSTKKVKKD